MTSLGRLESYNGSIELISGIKPKNGNSFPLVEAYDVLVGDNRRLDSVVDKLDNLVYVELSVSDNALVIGGGRGVTYFYDKVVDDKNYVLALFSEDISENIIGSRGIDVTEYISGGTLSIGGDINYNGVEFLPYVGSL